MTAPASIHSLRAPSVGLESWIVLDSTRRGPATGGIRIRTYVDSTAALDDACRLARAMTLKAALAGLPAGGGKIVVRSKATLDRPRAMEVLGRFLEHLDGRFFAGPDLGMTTEDLVDLGRFTRHAARVDPDDAASLARATARGVLVSLREALGGSLGGRRILLQGAGKVGRALIDLLLDEGASIAAADPAGVLDDRVEAVDSRELERLEGDVFCPCATGGLLTDRVAERLRVDLVCGSANNVLADEQAGRVLHRRGIVFAPDIATSAGALIEGVLGVAAAGPVIDAIGATVGRILEESARTGDRPEIVALRQAALRLAESPGRVGSP